MRWQCELHEKPADFSLSDITFLDNPGISKFPTLTFILSHAAVANLPRSHATDTFAIPLRRNDTKPFRNAGKVQLLLGTLLRPHAHADGVEIRKVAIAMNVPLLTTLSAAMAAVSAIQAMSKDAMIFDWINPCLSLWKSARNRLESSAGRASIH